ncbi:MAG: cysteine--tRNA ligase [Omnitrophica bacterium RIFCSPLOWO2_12_FULL_44_17]|uniref:Cysteine--tRNA ligase n=1 Tax=Candidatus Danuiimicrobium aquiferis TaxID=1801832 RepID=A0A1G1L060_9BACT|nr:MAG: cysteine--tRNA ligase [Omnitrophica bacterium RIFCSPHIGHO2_02_FULL_45_28]OGW89000.1 MAG: cysteine--tRNA ligase [Omnitrophica bacterium RIFCSPHIGHO2_12_FULL_44_12]OGW98511.1 MAG: cysteine--tRNA ligase [Omnitrophica bacterium RIFCSPLOWO2_12_FULL_44_17]OGX05063.1 MAG: cysteine--tRNA ligase [Omnitrophica bacterium RIFCSPLOWO2_02_FULL_44_11]
MNIQFHNTLSGKKEDFQPIRAGEILMYTCGPTVYDYAHIGNFRTFVFEDLLHRFLEFHFREIKDFKVNHVMNITDVDDKTIAGANRDGIPLAQYTKKYEDAFIEDLKTLNIKLPTVMPHAADEKEIQSMIQLVAKLIGNNHAYVKEGSVYFRISEFKNYGKLSKKDLAQNITGARVDVDEYDKEVGADFVLWKATKEGEPSWDSPWGKGRPGWHLECSSMSMKHLAETIDIHAGGEDLIFPHHENEIAQSEAATGKPFVKYWLHAKHLLVNGEKMSKSKGNFFTLRDLLAKKDKSGKFYDKMAIKYALLSTHYRTQLNFTFELLEEAKENIKKLDDCYFKCLSVAALGVEREANVASKKDFENHPKLSGLREYTTKMAEALQDDLNISVALANLFEVLREINSWFPGSIAIDGSQLRGVIFFFKLIDDLFGLDVSVINSVPERVIEMLMKIIEFRRKKEFGPADQIRKQINDETGWLVKDGRPGEPSTVKKKRRTWD